MQYLLDANVVIDADRDYYPIDRVPEFWDWLLYQATQGKIAIPVQMYDEIVAGSGLLVDWLRENKTSFVLSLRPDVSKVRNVILKGYTADPTEDEIQKIGKDPFIVAYALVLLGNGKETTVVTTEVSKPKAQRANRQLPDVCKTFDVTCINTYTMIKELDFRTSWQSV